MTRSILWAWLTDSCSTYNNVAYLPDEVRLMIPTDPVSLASQ